MNKIYTLDDRLSLKIEGVEVIVRPLSRKEKADVQGLIINGEILEATATAMKYAIQDVKGLVNGKGKAYKLGKENGILTEKTVDDLLNMSMATDVGSVCLKLLNGVPKELEGVEFEKGEPRGKK